MIFPEISSAHFQLTGACNLKCIFCGQQNGMFSSRKQAEELTFDQWVSLAKELKKEFNPLPEIMLWGGEPLLYPEFDRLARTLSDMGFLLGIVTNGTLIDHHAELLAERFHTVYISLDGDAQYHNSIRGKGVFEKVSANIRLLAKRKSKLVFLCTLADGNVLAADAITRKLDALNPDLLVVQQLMYFSKQELSAYRTWLSGTFGMEDPGLDVWMREDDGKYRRDLAAAFRTIRRNITQKVYRHEVRISGHCSCGHTCEASFRRIHVQYNGDVLFCTDFYGFTAGSVKQNSIHDIFYGKLAEKYRAEILAGHNPLCRHCSWKKNSSFRLD